MIEHTMDMDTKTEERYIEALQARLADRIAHHATTVGTIETPVSGLHLYRFDGPTHPTSYTMEPRICAIAQGSKGVLVGDERYDYDAHHFLVTSVGMPVIANIVDASPEKPYLGLTYHLDPRELGRLMVDGNINHARSKSDSRGIGVSPVTVPLLNAFLRLLELLDEPEHIPVIEPMIQREILFRLLMSEQGPKMREIGMAGSHENQIARAIGWLRENFTEHVKVDDLAAEARMSTSAFHQRFRTLTSMSPLQYQKWLRLHEARRLMLTERVDAAGASFRVGYESPSQFSREYRRLFGAPPLQDIKKLQQTP